MCAAGEQGCHAAALRGIEGTDADTYETGANTYDAASGDQCALRREHRREVVAHEAARPQDQHVGGEHAAQQNGHCRQRLLEAHGFGLRPEAAGVGYRAQR